MSDVDKLLPILPRPGIQRDGTELNVQSLTFIDGEWVRFQHGAPRKMGGFRRVSNLLSGPVNAVKIYASNGFANIFCFSPFGIESIRTDYYGLGSGLVSRTPSGFTADDRVRWSVAEMYDDAAGSDEAILIAVACPTGTSLDTLNEGSVYSGVLSDDTEFTVVSGITAKGVFVTQPYAIYYGASGSVAWSNANEPLTLTSGDAGSDRVTGANIVAGLPLPTGSGPGGLLWSLDSVIRMDWVGGQAIFRFSTLTTSSSILSQNAAVELDGTYYWAGVDRFFVSNGSQVQRLKNTTNQNWFFDNIRPENRVKVWAETNPKYGEIIWHFPFGDATECSHAVVFNVLEECWYDYTLSRTAGDRMFSNPMLVAPPDGVTRISFTLGTVTGDFDTGDILKGASSEVSYRIFLIQEGVYYAERVDYDGNWVVGESIVNQTQTGAGSLTTLSYLCSLYIHEFGMDRVEGEYVSAIPSSITTSSIGLPSTQDAVNRWIRLLRIEPDFLQNGYLKFYVLTKEFANSDEVVHGPFLVSPTTEKLDLRIQGRHVFIQVESNSQNGDFMWGRVTAHVEAGDIRS